MRRLRAAMAAAFLFWPGPAGALEAWRSLAGVKEVFVVVEGVGPELSKYMITNESFKKDLEKSQRKEGVTVLLREQWLRKPESPVLRLSLSPRRLPGGLPAKEGYQMDLSLNQDAHLLPDGPPVALATTWRASMVVFIMIPFFDGKAAEVADQMDVKIPPTLFLESAFARLRDGFISNLARANRGRKGRP